MKKAAVVTVLLGLALWVLANLLQAQRTTVVETPLDLDFKSPGRGGGLAFYMECRQLWSGTRRMGWERHWQERAKIVVSVRYLSTNLLGKMLDWVREGHEAVLIIYAHEGFLSELKLDYVHNADDPALEAGMVRRTRGPLLKDSDGSLHLYARRPLGKGHVTVLVDPWSISNDGLDRGRNPELARELVGGDATFLCPSSDMDWESLLLLSNWTRLTLLGAAALTLLYGRNHYLPWGRPRTLPDPPQRSMMEFVDAAGWLLQRARAFRLAVESLERGAAVRLGRRLQDEERIGEVYDGNVLQLVRKFQKYITEAGR